MGEWRFTLVHTATGCACGDTTDFEVVLSWFTGDDHGFGMHHLLAQKARVTQTITTPTQLHTLAVIVTEE